MAFCSAVTLCFASIFSLAAAALLAIAFSTDNWQVISVSERLNAAETDPGQSLQQKRLIIAAEMVSIKIIGYCKNDVCHKKQFLFSQLQYFK